MNFEHSSIFCVDVVLHCSLLIYHPFIETANALSDDLTLYVTTLRM